MRRSRRRRVSSTRAQRAPQNAARSNTGTFPFLSGRDSKPNKSPFPFNVLAALTGTNRGNVEGCSTSQLHPFEGEPTDSRAGFGFLPATGHLGGCGGKELCKQSLAVFRPRPPVRVHPPPGRGGTGASNGVWGRVLRKSCRVWEAEVGRQVSGSSAVLRQRQQAGALQTLRDLGGAVRTWRDAFHRVPWPGWNRALHRILTTGPGCNPAFQGDAISTGGSRGAWGWSCRRAVAGRETVARRGGPSAGAPAAEERSECATVQEWAGPWGGGYELGGRMRVHSRGPASFGLGPWRDSGGFGDPLVYRAPAPAVPAQPPRQPVQKLKCAAPKECGCRGLDLEGRAD